MKALPESAKPRFSELSNYLRGILATTNDGVFNFCKNTETEGQQAHLNIRNDAASPPSHDKQGSSDASEATRNHLTPPSETSQRSDDGQPNQLVTIGVPPFLRNCPEIATTLNRPNRAAPQFEEATSEFELTNSLMKRKVDFGIFTQAPDNTSLSSLPLAKAAAFLAVGLNHPLARGSICKPTDLPKANFCLPCQERFPGLYDSLKSAFERLLPDMCIVGTHHTMEELTVNAVVGACCPTYDPKIPNRKGRTAILQIQGLEPQTFYLWWRSDLQSEGAKALVTSYSKDE